MACKKTEISNRQLGLRVRLASLTLNQVDDLKSPFFASQPPHISLDQMSLRSIAPFTVTLPLPLGPISLRLPPPSQLQTPFVTHAACYLHSFSTLQTLFVTHAACYLHSFSTLQTPFVTHAACYLHSFCIPKRPFDTHASSFGTPAACYKQRSAPILLAICMVFAYSATCRSAPTGPVRHPRVPICAALAGNHESHFGWLII